MNRLLLAGLTSTCLACSACGDDPAQVVALPEAKAAPAAVATAISAVVPVRPAPAPAAPLIDFGGVLRDLNTNTAETERGEAFLIAELSATLRQQIEAVLNNRSRG